MPGFFERWFAMRTLGALVDCIVIGIGAMFVTGTLRTPTDLAKMQLPDR